MHNRVLFPSDNSENILYISETTIDEEFKAIKHSHPNLEIIYVTDGFGYIQVTNETKQIICNHGDLIIINKNIKHYEASTNNYLRFFAIGINNLSIINKDNIDPIIKLNLQKDDSKTINNLFTFIYNEAINKSNQYLKLTSFYLKAIYALLKRNSDLTYNQSINSNLSSYVQNIKQLIDNFFYLPLSLDEISKKVSLSIPYLCYEFKKEMSQTIFEYKQTVQVNEAKNLLRLTDLSISEIASSTGFNNSSYFTKIFKAKTGMIPKQYRLEPK